MKTKNLLTAGFLSFLLTACNYGQQTPSGLAQTSNFKLFGIQATDPVPTPAPQPAPGPTPELVNSCNRCHGLDGNGSNALFARIGAQQEDYLVAQLKNFRDDLRADKDGKLFMTAVAKKLTEQEILDIAHYYATRPVPTPIAGNAALITKGEDIYKNGSGDSVMACIACHGEKGEGMSTNPRLAGQFPRETIKQLKYYKNGDRKDDMMAPIAAAMTDEQMSAVAAYVAAIDNVAPPALTPADPGATLVNSCNKCHGVDGVGTNPMFARLGAQSEEYLVTQLKEFRSGTRGGKEAKVFMYSVAKKLSDQDIVSLAHFYSVKPAGAPLPGNADVIAAGELIYKNGVGDTVMACYACHGEKADGFSLNPRLAGQFPRETIKQMANYKTADRKDDMMAPIAAGLSDEQVKAVAAYLSSLQ